MSRAHHLLPLGFFIVGAAVFTPRQASAFTACTANAGSGVSGHWPDSRNTSNFGTQKWEFDWQIAGQGLEVSNVKYTSDLAQSKKMVMRRASIPMLPVHYPENPPTCPGPIGPYPHGFSDQLIVSDSPMCCAHVPTLVCNEPDRVSSCNPKTSVISSCPSGAPMCTGVCLGTQVDSIAPTEDGVGEGVSGASNADIALTGQFTLGGYIFEQRWRFQDNGTIIPSMRLGGIHDCQFHSHQIYYRFNFELGAAGAGTEAVEQCGAGGCPDLGTSGWTTLTATCGNRPGPTTEWRMTDATAPGRGIILQTAANEGSPASFCEGTAVTPTNTDCKLEGGCFNNRDFCALPAAEPLETFTANKCNDHLADGANGTSPSDFAFWYLAHVDHHDPCTFLPMCDPAIGTLAFGPTIRAVGY